MKNGCGKSFQNDIISVILSQKGENPSLSSLRMRGMGLKRFCSEFLISSLREESATNELASPKLGGKKQDAFVLPPPRRTWRVSNPLINRYSTLQQSGGIFPESCPLILFRIIGWGIDPGADGRPLLTSEISVFGVAQTPTIKRKDSQAFLPPHWRHT